MINPASLAFDIDGLVADTMSLFLEIVRDVHNISGIRYKQPWNRVPHPYREINSWKELEALIDF
jgi:hypothetical protein